jgi:predicted pyridoxine 5'-phosphate oxidase superfamily flavin-nucleotide-binding protein
MKPETLQKAVRLGQKLQHVFVATADSQGLPHLAAAGRMDRITDERLAVTAWFCPGTLHNLDQNRRISLVVWDAPSDTGYQIFGEVQDIEEQAYLNGFVPEMKEAVHPPQVERKLIVRPEKVIGFSHAPHSDIEE